MRRCSQCAAWAAPPSLLLSELLGTVVTSGWSCLHGAAEPGILPGGQGNPVVPPVSTLHEAPEASGKVGGQQQPRGGRVAPWPWGSTWAGDAAAGQAQGLTRVGGARARRARRPCPPPPLAENPSLPSRGCDQSGKHSLSFPLALGGWEVMEGFRQQERGWNLAGSRMG